MNHKGPSQPGILYVSDLDGTLLGDDAALSARTWTLLCDLLAAGLPFTVASGRSVISIQRVLAGIPLRLPIIEFNGGFITDLATGRHVRVHAIDPEVAGSLHDAIRRDGHVPLVSTFDGERDRLYHERTRNAGTDLYLHDLQLRRDGRLTPVEDVRVGLADEVVCLTVIGEESAMRDLEVRLRSSWSEAVCTHCIEDRYSPGWFWLTVHDRRATKQGAVKLLIEQCDLGDVELVVFGDQDNDMGLFDLADRAIAVANATEELKRRATVVIGTNREDSVARFLQEDWSARCSAASGTRSTDQPVRSGARK